MNPTPNVRDIAREARVHYSTVSMALRNHPRISQATRVRIFKIAQSMGYRTNPLVASLMAKVKAAKRVTYVGNIAYLFDSKKLFYLYPHFEMERKSLHAQATSLGFRIEMFFLEDYPKGAESLSKVLHNRGIEAVIFDLLSPPEVLASFDWTLFAFASIGNRLGPNSSDLFSKKESACIPAGVPFVQHNHWQGILLALEKVASRGYVRPALCLRPGVGKAPEYDYSAAFCFYQQSLKVANRIPLLSENETSRAFADWLKKYKPDILISHEDSYRTAASRLGFDTAFINLDWIGGPESGINQHRDWIAASAIDLVVAQLHRNERGVPLMSRNTIVDGEWIEGNTMPNLREK